MSPRDAASFAAPTGAAAVLPASLLPASLLPASLLPASLLAASFPLAGFALPSLWPASLAVLFSLMLPPLAPGPFWVVMGRFWRAVMMLSLKLLPFFFVELGGVATLLPSGDVFGVSFLSSSLCFLGRSFRTLAAELPLAERCRRALLLLERGRRRALPPGFELCRSFCFLSFLRLDSELLAARRARRERERGERGERERLRREPCFDGIARTQRDGRTWSHACTSLQESGS
mmetsp:Transcript_22711/g.43597  ORF Transcript_22711/g.43597 Transcript_22711/m.43597 type:complete len:232 (+) Transcript_22711:1274-1969(+)